MGGLPGVYGLLFRGRNYNWNYCRVTAERGDLKSTRPLETNRNLILQLFRYRSQRNSSNYYQCWLLAGWTN